ncbi:hypothetical protein KXW98_005241 [Aspergillus fumigatus]|uniref:Xylanolytic transcriptional activator regulatory domain-containing protein n=1 Tax=Aspergillus fumigatus TaxID=746128 RepID=A0A9P8SS76_ASPFM|nr:hypothetical protein KXX45_004319 [Aspergillus fumigatus]KAH1346045.1 hypothetical protein KXX67_008714 [Aspergillus fumigatus]KAH1355365.1 hypothetical protein KXX14_000401 [Aspergillus fumigatus]KAH1364028.1 hypothetical protein KXX33_002083 [Aspergillus fumigatus]KAH1378817.1 hypothetical protein KXX50_008338 [Aspergillus fumigatus]
MGTHVDGLKFAGGSFSLFQEKPLRELIDLAHDYGVYVSTGGWAEHLLTHPDANTVFDKYLKKCKDLGFDVIELSSGFLSFPEDDWLGLVDKVHAYKLKAKPELGIQFGAGGDTPASGLEAIGTSDPGKLVNMGRKFLDVGVERLMIESEGITENVQSWRTDVVSTIMKELPSERVMFEAADPKETMLLSEHMVPTPQRQTAMDRLLNALEDHSADLEQQTTDDKDGTAPVPKVARLLRDGQGKFMYIGDSASLSFLQSVRRIVSLSIGRCEFTEDTSRHSMLEAFQGSSATQTGPLSAPPSNDEAQRLARQYVLATSPLLDLFDLEEFYQRLANWVGNPTVDEDTVSSIFYLVLAIGVQVSEVNQDLAEQYFVSGRQLAFSAFTETPSIYTIQSYVLISMYMLGACRRNGAFMNLGIALRAAYAVGIHRRDANALFCTRERRARERVWKSLRMIDLFLSASLGRPPATSDFDHDVRDPATLAGEQQLPRPEAQLSQCVVALCRIFDRILTEVYMKQVVSINVAETISNQHRAWVRYLPTFLSGQTERLSSKNLESMLAAAHVFGAYYWSIILLTRPFFIFRVSQYVKSKSDPGISSNDPRASASRIALFSDACVYSALRCLNIVDDLSRFEALPRRLPFLINSVFNSAVVLGAAFFAEYDNLLPLEEGMDKSEKFLGLFVPHDPHACRFYQIIKYLRGAVAEYVRRRNRQWMERRSKQVDQLFGQVGLRSEPSASSDDVVISRNGEPLAPSPSSPEKLATGSLSAQGAQPTASTGESENDIWNTLCGTQGATALPYDSTISTLTTTGIPIGCSPGGTLTTAQPGMETDAGGQTPLSDVLFSENGLLYMAEDLSVFGLWGDTC